MVRSLSRTSSVWKTILISTIVDEHCGTGDVIGVWKTILISTIVDCLVVYMALPSLKDILISKIADFSSIDLVEVQRVDDPNSMRNTTRKPRRGSTLGEVNMWKACLAEELLHP